MKRIFATIFLAFLVVFLAACDVAPNPDKVQRASQRVLSEQSNAQVGMPELTKFTEKRMMKKIIELRDRAISTYTYIPDQNGRLFHVCDSIGYGLPYSAQYTNPQRPNESWEPAGVTLPQADPNGLFMPESADGTWVACVDKGSTDFKVVYLEPRIVVSPFKLAATGEYQVQ
jgi:hypothetical protein